MGYDFPQFLKDSEKKCKTRDEFIKRISKEMESVITIPSARSSYLDRKAYYKRLEGAEFAAKYDQFKEPDIYNEELMILLYNLT